MRLSICNSSRQYIIAVLVFLVFLAGVESYYRSGNIPAEEQRISTDALPREHAIYLIGDSRVMCGVNPEIIDAHLPDFSTINLGQNGLNLNLFLNASEQDFKKPGILLIGVSPASLFGKFNSGRSKSINKILHISDYLNDEYAKLHFLSLHYSYGFAGLLDVALSGQPSIRSTKLGWHPIFRTDRDQAFCRGLNYYTYKNIVLERIDSISANKASEKFSQILGALKVHYKIILFRVPTSPVMRGVENENFGWFDAEISRIATGLGIQYFSSPANFTYGEQGADYSHLNYYKATEYSQLLADYVEQCLAKNTVQ